MKKLIIDPGHGGKDSGAVSCTKKLEKTFNLNVALKVAELFKDHPEVEVILTRSTDIFIELNQRSDMANLMKADAFISIHANSFMKSSNGTETYYTNDFSRSFAETFHPYMVQATGFKRNKVIRKSLSVTRKTTMPAILLEPGFLSNPEEEAVLMTDEFQSRFALAIAQGACAFLGVPYSVSTAAPTQTPTLTQISVIVDAQTLTGYLLNGTAWIPAKPVLNYLQALWTFQDKKIILNAVPIETMLVDNQSYIKARDVMPISRVFFDDTEKPKRIDIFPLLEVIK